MLFRPRSAPIFGSLADSRAGPVDIPSAMPSCPRSRCSRLKTLLCLAFDHAAQTQGQLPHHLRDQSVPSDSQMRANLDSVDPMDLRPMFSEDFRRLTRQGAETLRLLKGHYLISLDGTGYFSSSKIHCPSCLVKNRRNGRILPITIKCWAHAVHPDLKEVIPVPEPIIQQDGRKERLRAERHPA